MRDSGKNIVIVAHVQEKDDEGRVIKRPMVTTRLATELVNLVDIVGYMTTVSDGSGETKRVIMVDPSSDKFVAKDRTGQLGKYIEPDFTKIVDGVRGDKAYPWINSTNKKVSADDIKKATTPEVPGFNVSGAELGDNGNEEK